MNPVPLGAGVVNLNVESYWDGCNGILNLYPEDREFELLTKRHGIIWCLSGTKIELKSVEWISKLYQVEDISSLFNKPS